MPLSYWRAFASGAARDEAVFQARIIERLGVQTRAFPIGRARSGIYLLAKLAMLSGRSKVLMSPYTIPDVVTMVMLAGATPVFYDFYPDSTSCNIEGLAEEIDGDTACVFITHYHVNEPGIDKIAEICRSRGVYLFDDCALSFGGMIDGKPMGSVTDASVFSFSSFKLLNFFWGGMITTRDPELGALIEDTIAQWPRLRSNDYLSPARAIFKYDVASRPPFFSSLVFPMLRRRLDKAEQASGLEYVRIETDQLNATLTSRPSLAAFGEWSRKLSKIDAWLLHRRLIAEIYRRHVGAHMVSADTSNADRAGACFVNFPVLVPPEWREEIIRAMMLSGYDVGRSLYPNAHRHPKFGAVEGRSANVDRLVSGLIYLPTHFGVSESYATNIGVHLAGQLERLVGRGA